MICLICWAVRSLGMTYFASQDSSCCNWRFGPPLRRDLFCRRPCGCVSSTFLGPASSFVSRALGARCAQQALQTVHLPTLVIPTAPASCLPTSINMHVTASSRRSNISQVGGVFGGQERRQHRFARIILFPYSPLCLRMLHSTNVPLLRLDP